MRNKLALPLMRLSPIPNPAVVVTPSVWPTTCHSVLCTGRYSALELTLTACAIVQAAFRRRNIIPSASEIYSAVDMEDAIEAMTQVPDSAVVHCKRDEVDEVRHRPMLGCGLVVGARNCFGGSMEGLQHQAMLREMCIPAQGWCACMLSCPFVLPVQVDICMNKRNPPQPIACPNKRPNTCGNILLPPLGSQTTQSTAAETV